MRVGITMGHEYMYVSVSGQWRMVKCGCSATAPICSFAAVLPRGTKWNLVRKLRQDEEMKYDQRLAEIEQARLAVERAVAR